MVLLLQQQQLQNRPYSSRGQSSTPDVFDDEDEDGLEAAYFKAQQQMEGEKGGPVDLTVTNLDYNISKKEWKKILAATFQPQVQVSGFFFCSSSGASVAILFGIANQPLELEKCTVRCPEANVLMELSVQVFHVYL